MVTPTGPRSGRGTELGVAEACCESKGVDRMGLMVLIISHAR